MARFIKKGVFFFLIFFVLLNLIAFGIDFLICRSEAFKTNILFNKELPENIIIGSSRALTGIDTRELSKLTSQNWYNLSIDDTPIEIHLLVYQLLLKNGKTPKSLILQYDGTTFSSEKNSFHDKDYQFMPFAFRDELVIKDYLVKYNVSWGYAYYNLPIIKYTLFNTELMPIALISIFNKKYHHRFNENGDYDYPERNDGIVISKNKYEENLDLENPSLLKLVSLCSENKTDLIIYTAPILNKRKIVKESNLRYFNFSQLLNDTSCFYDELHLNAKGKKILTRSLASEIKLKKLLN